MSITLKLKNGSTIKVEGTSDRDVAIYRAKKLGFKLDEARA